MFSSFLHLLLIFAQMVPSNISFPLCILFKMSTHSSCLGLKVGVPQNSRVEFRYENLTTEGTALGSGARGRCLGHVGIMGVVRTVNGTTALQQRLHRGPSLLLHVRTEFEVCGHPDALISDFQPPEQQEINFYGFSSTQFLVFCYSCLNGLRQTPPPPTDTPRNCLSLFPNYFSVYL